jgi:Leucine-rich repeat (LRR) protein
MLEELTLSDNKIKDVPASLFHKLEKTLKVLNLADNRIKHIP